MKHHRNNGVGWETWLLWMAASLGWVWLSFLPEKGCCSKVWLQLDTIFTTYCYSSGVEFMAKGFEWSECCSFEHLWNTSSQSVCYYLCANLITGKVCAMLFSHRLKVDFLEPLNLSLGNYWKCWIASCHLRFDWRIINSMKQNGSHRWKWKEMLLN